MAANLCTTSARRLPELEQQAERLRTLGWLRVKVPLDAPDVDLNRKVRQLLGTAVVSVDYELPDRPDHALSSRRDGVGPAELFSLYRQAAYGTPPEAALSAAFNQLLREAEELAE
jgi:hypothetical protein